MNSQFSKPATRPHSRSLGRQPLRLVVFVLAVVAVMLSACVEKAFADKPSAPNIVFILADDLGYGEVGCFGQTMVQTPRIDRMAAEGLRFTQFYAGATVCAPSRSVLMTGLNQGHTRVRGNAGKTNPLAQALRPEDVTVAKVLKGAGYATALIGKWGLGDVGEAECGLPRKQGFDYFYGYLSQHHAHNHFPDFLWRNEEKVSLPNDIVPLGESGAGYATKPVAYADDLFADEAVKWVAEHQKGPFFLYWAMVIPHANNERTRALKDGAEVPDYGPYADKDWPVPNRGHAAMISRMDSYVGRMLDQLQKLGLAQNTLVIFTSDNGPHKESGHDPELFRPYGAVRGFKRDLTDGGIRVPTVAWWPSHIAPGRTTNQVGYFGDILATAADLSGAKAPAQLDSISLTPTLRGDAKDQKQHEYLYWEFHERGFNQAVIYQGRWKGIRMQPDGPLVVYDLSADLKEQTDVAAQHPEIVARLEAYLKTARSDSPDWPIRRPAKKPK